MMYEKMDQLILVQQKKIAKKFRRCRAVIGANGFDELNVINKTKSLYKELETLNNVMFIELANYYYKKATNSDKKLSKEWLIGLLLGYDYITKYVYTHEVERKRARLAESLIATQTKIKNFKTAYDLWFRQTKQYALNITDEATLQGYKDIGVEYVKWNSFIDSRTCPTCRERNGKVYAIDKVPRKPHYNCRCYLTPYKKITRGNK